VQKPAVTSVNIPWAGYAELNKYLLVASLKTEHGCVTGCGPSFALLMPYRTEASATGTKCMYLKRVVYQF
jgi:hypothetical protein